MESGRLPVTPVLFTILSEAVDDISQALANMRKAGTPLECDFLITLQEKLDILLVEDNEESVAGASEVSLAQDRSASSLTETIAPPSTEPLAAPVQKVNISETSPTEEIVSDWNPADFEEMLPDFVTEVTEILENFSNDLISLENDRHNKDLLNRIFRYAHTIKGSSGMMELKVDWTLSVMGARS